MNDIPVLCPNCGLKVELEPPPKDTTYDNPMRKPVPDQYYYVDSRRCLGKDKHEVLIYWKRRS